MVWLPLCLFMAPINFWMPEPIVMKRGMYEYVTAPEPVLTAYS
jgi:hypothetical protein